MSFATNNDAEARLGILCYVNQWDAGFTATLKTRYTDFLVNEIDKDGTVVHLTDDSVPTNQFQQQITGTDKSSHAHTVPAAISPLAQSSTNTQHGGISSPNQDNEMAPTTRDAWDVQVLLSYFGPDVTNSIYAMYEKALANPQASNTALKAFGSVSTGPISDRALRTTMHSQLRRIFDSRIESSTDPDTGCITLWVTAKRDNSAATTMTNQQRPVNRVKGKIGWNELGGEYLHFSLYKENKDTMEVISFLARLLRISGKEFTFAGTKDRRAVTVQRVSVHRQYAQDLAKLNPTLKQSRLGNFKYEPKSLDLGDNTGNHFLITLKNCHFEGEGAFDDEFKLKLADTVVSQATKHMHKNGFINYFGAQRFGTFYTRTDEIGLSILRGNYKEAVDSILSCSEEVIAAVNNTSWQSSTKISQDDLARANAIQMFKSTGDTHHALRTMPRKFTGETAILRHLGSANNQNDYLGALKMIPRNLRIMYPHAYQSRVWNFVASERWARYGKRVVSGDLVLVDRQKAQSNEDEADDSGEIVIRPGAGDKAVTQEAAFQQARALSKDEAESGKYTVYDVVIPLPGYDVNYPNNDIGDYYKLFMNHHGTDPADMRRTENDFSLSGSYRKLMATVTFIYKIRAYKDDTEQLVETDFDKLKQSHPEIEQAKAHSDENDRGNRRGGSYDTRFTRGGRGAYHSDRALRGREKEYNHFPSRPSRPGFGRQEPAATQVASSSTPRPYVSPPAGYTEAQKKAHKAWQDFPAKAEQEAEAALAQWKAERSKPKVDTNLANFAPVSVKETWNQVSIKDGVRTKVAKHVFHTNPEGLKQEGEKVSEDLKHEEVKGSEDLKHEEEKGSKGLDNQPSTFEAQRDTPPHLRHSRPAPMGFDGAGDDFDAFGGGFPHMAAASSFASAAFGSQLLANESNKTAESPSKKRSSDAITTSPILAQGESAAKFENKPKNFENQAQKIAVILEFDLASSVYATVALRELCKADGMQIYKPDYSSGR